MEFYKSDEANQIVHEVQIRTDTSEKRVYDDETDDTDDLADNTLNEEAIHEILRLFPAGPPDFPKKRDVSQMHDSDTETSVDMSPLLTGRTVQSNGHANDDTKLTPVMRSLRRLSGDYSSSSVKSLTLGSFGSEQSSLSTMPRLRNRPRVDSNDVRIYVLSKNREEEEHALTQTRTTLPFNKETGKAK